MTRLGLVLLLLLATLLGCTSTPLSTAPSPSATARPQPPPPAPVQQPPQTSPPSDPEIVVTPLQPSDMPLQISKEIGKETGAVRAEPHIALLLPTRSRDFSRAADIVREGFENAATFQADKALRVKVYPLTDEADALLTAYQQAIASGARCVVAGLTRDGAAAIATSGRISVPTLTLNQVDQQSMPVGPFYTLSLSLEDEARQVAKLITDQGLSQVALLVGSSVLSKRIRSAFEQEWTRTGGDIVVTLQLNRDSTEYSKFRSALQKADAVFIAAESPLVRQVMPYIARGLPIFATSQVYDGKTTPGANVDLQGIRFVDMPWLVDPSHTAVAVYPRSSKAVSAELDRLYALGIDAYRIAYIIATKEIVGPGWLDGVTGTITLYDSHRFQRDLVPAYLEGDQAVPLKQPPQ